MEATTGRGPWPVNVGPVEILSGLVKFPIISIQIMGFESRLWDFGVIGPVDKTVSFHVCTAWGLCHILLGIVLCAKMVSALAFWNCFVLTWCLI